MAGQLLSNSTEATSHFGGGPGVLGRQTLGVQDYKKVTDPLGKASDRLVGHFHVAGHAVFLKRFEDGFGVIRGLF